MRRDHDHFSSDVYGYDKLAHNFELTPVISVYNAYLCCTLISLDL